MRRFRPEWALPAIPVILILALVYGWIHRFDAVKARHTQAAAVAPVQSGGPVPQYVACSPTALDSCYRADQMPAYLELITRWVGEFFGSQYQSPARPTITYVPNGYVTTGPCPPENETVAEFCHAKAGSAINLGQSVLWKYFQVDDKAGGVILAHEWSHFVQSLADPDDFSSGLSKELEADCGSGAWFGYAQAHGVADDSDLARIHELMDVIGNPTMTLDRSHGVAEERLKAFYAGLRGGLLACTPYNPGTPLLVRG